MTQIDGHAVAGDVRTSGYGLLAGAADGELDFTFQSVRLEELNDFCDFVFGAREKDGCRREVALE